MDSVFDCIRCSLPLCLETARLLGPLPQPDCTRLGCAPTANCGGVRKVASRRDGVGNTAPCLGMATSNGVSSRREAHNRGEIWRPPNGGAMPACLPRYLSKAAQCRLPSVIILSTAQSVAFLLSPIIFVGLFTM